MTVRSKFGSSSGGVASSKPSLRRCAGDHRPPSCHRSTEVGAATILHDHAFVRMIMRWLSTSASSGRPGTPAPSSSACSPGTPSIDVVVRHGRHAGRHAGRGAVPVARRGLPRPRLVATDDAAVAAVDGLDVVFLGLPHQASMALAPQLVGKVGCVVDLSAAYRLKDASLYPQWYGFSHDQPELLAEAVYGLPERHRTELVGARLIATPGCYVTAATLGLGAAARRRARRAHRHHRRRRQRRHRRRPGGQAGPTRSAPSTRTSRPTACSTTATRPRSSRTSRRPGAVHAAPGADEPRDPGHLLRPAGRRRRRRRPRCWPPCATPTPTSRSSSSSTASPSTKATLGSNTAHVTARYDERTGTVVAIAAIDNLTKGACGGAAAGRQRRPRPRRGAGLPLVGVAP